jgi:hypothetical protein
MLRGIWGVETLHSLKFPWGIEILKGREQIVASQI